MSAEQIAKRFARLFGSDDPEYILQQEVQLQKEIEQYAESKLKERDELLEEMATLLSGTYKPSEWVSAVEKTKEVLTRYSNLKAK